MKKFEEELNNGLVSIGQNIITKEYAYGKDALINYFKDWISPEDHQNTVASNKAYEKSNRTLSEEKAKFVVENIVLQKQIAELKSQLEKQQPEIPEVPQFVADWYEENKGSLDYMIFETCRDLTDESTNEFENWFGYDENKAITTLVNMKNGYTVAKEKRFYLKNKFTGNYLSSIPESNAFYHIMVRDPKVNGLVRSFTQSEIDSMAADSYEQIEVEEKHGYI